MVQAEGTARAKALGQYHGWCVAGTAKRKPVCMQQSEGGGEREEGRAGRPPGRWWAFAFCSQCDVEL